MRDSIAVDWKVLGYVFQVMFGLLLVGFGILSGFNQNLKAFFLFSLWLNSGAFKIRGACNAVFSLDDAQAAKGVVTHSRSALGSFVSYNYFLWFTCVIIPRS